MPPPSTRAPWWLDLWLLRSNSTRSPAATNAPASGSASVHRRQPAISRSGSRAAALPPPPVPGDVAFQETAQVAPGRLEPIHGEAENPLRFFGVRVPGECAQRDAHDPLRLFAVAGHRLPRSRPLPRMSGSYPAPLPGPADDDGDPERAGRRQRDQRGQLVPPGELERVGRQGHG